MSAIAPTSPTEVSYKRGTGGAPPDNLGGTTYYIDAAEIQNVLAAGTGNKALNADGTHKGNTYVLAAGSTYSGTLAIPAAVGTGWTRVISGGTLPAVGTTVTPSNAAQLAKLVQPAAGSINPAAHALEMTVPTQGWIFTGLELTHGVTVARYGIIYIDPTVEHPDGSKDFYPFSIKRVIFDRCYVHPAVGQDEVANAFWVVDVEDFQMWDSWVVATATYPSTLTAEAHAIFIRRGRRIHVEHNELRGTTENILVGDGYSGAGDLGSAHDVTIARNHCFKPMSWFYYLLDGQTPNAGYVGPSNSSTVWAVKNNFEIKAAVRLLAMGNLLENNITQGYYILPTQSDQFGEAMVINAGDQAEHVGSPGPYVSDIEWRSNHIHNTPQAFTLSAGYCSGPPVTPWPERVWVHNNLGTHVGGTWCLLNKSWRDTVVEHNTIIPGDLTDAGNNSDNKLTYMASLEWRSYGNTDWYPNLAIRRNIMGPAQPYWAFKDVTTSVGSGDGAMKDTKAAIILPGSDRLENVVIAPFNSGTFTGFQSYATATAAGVNANGTLTAESPLRAGGGVSTDGFAVGVDFPSLEADLAGDEPPVVPQISFTWQPQSGTLAVTFTNTSNNAAGATWLWSFGDQTTSPLESVTHVYQAANPNPGYTVTLAATISGQTYTATQLVTVAAIAPVTLRRTTLRASSKAVV